MNAAGVKQGKLGVPQSVSSALAFFHLAIKVIHEPGRNRVVHIPQSGDNLVCARAHECPLQAQQPFQGLHVRSYSFAG